MNLHGDSHAAFSKESRQSDVREILSFAESHVVIFYIDFTGILPCYIEIFENSGHWYITVYECNSILLFYMEIPMVGLFPLKVPCGSS